MKQKGFSNLIIIVVVGILVIVGIVGYFTFIKTQEVPPASTPISGKLPEITLIPFSPIAAGGSGISITPTSFINNVSQQNLPGSSDVYSYKTLFSSEYVAELAKIFDIPPLKNGVAEGETMDKEKKYLIGDYKNGFYLEMVSGGYITLGFEVKKDSLLWTIPEITDSNKAIQQAQKWLAQYPQIFGDINNWSGKYEHNNDMVTRIDFFPLQPEPLYRAPYINIFLILEKDRLDVVISWISSHNEQISNYKLRSIDDVWKDLSSDELRGYYDTVLSVPLSGVNNDYLAKHNGAITGTFTANEVSLAHGRLDNLSYDSPEFFLAPVYVFSGLLDTGVQKLPLEIWTPAVPYEK